MKFYLRLSMIQNCFIVQISCTWPVTRIILTLSSASTGPSLNPYIHFSVRWLWNTPMKTDHPHVKLYIKERITCHFLLKTYCITDTKKTMKSTIIMCLIRFLSWEQGNFYIQKQSCLTRFFSNYVLFNKFLPNTPSKENCVSTKDYY
jgi:hypothetical protein